MCVQEVYIIKLHFTRQRWNSFLKQAASEARETKVRDTKAIFLSSLFTFIAHTFFDS